MATAEQYLLSFKTDVIKHPEPIPISSSFFFSFLAGALGLDILSFGILMLIFECDLNDFMFYCMGVLLFNPALMGEGWYVNYG